ncbi:hypothetical protein C8J57DRAFT_1053191 [Mycena rebaudengoi]|nr:hypothetical protein C8J57DRAFT_1053191 [Mycena rebaudengoi]
MAAPDTTTGGDMLFRVHQSMLSLQSPVFASMFTLPHPHDNRDMYDGTPFVRMPDEAQDIESLLKVLYNPSELPYKRLDPMTPILVRRTLAMATKYEMDTLRTRIVTQIEADWPSTLAEWDRLETEIGSLAIFDDDGVCLDRRLPEPGAAISLAMDYRITKILPAAFYHLSRLSTTADWDADPNGLDEDARTARWSFLHATELKLLLKVRETIANFEQLAMPAPSKSCSTNAACDYAWEVAHLRWISAKDPLYAMQEFVESRPLGGPCKYCWATGKEPIRKHRGELWDEIYDCIQEHCP